MGDDRKRWCWFFFVFLFTLTTSSVGCIFGPSRFHGVMSYRHGKVYLYRDRYYRVGKLPQGWGRLKTGVRTISFYHAGFQSTISTDAYCGDAYDGAPPEVSLARMIGGVVAHPKTIRERHLELAGRHAIHKHLRGTIDGVPMNLEMVTVAKDVCLFDFVAISPEAADPQVSHDFEAFYSVFQYH